MKDANGEFRSQIYEQRPTYADFEPAASSQKLSVYTVIGGYGELFPRQYAVLYDGRADDGSMEGRTLKPKYINRIIETEADND